MVTVYILVESCLDIKIIGHLANMGNPAGHALVGVANQWDEVLGYCTLHQYPPQCILVHAVERFLIVDEDDIEGDFHSSDCPIMIRRLSIWSARDLLLLERVVSLGAFGLLPFSSSREGSCWGHCQALTGALYAPRQILQSLKFFFFGSLMKMLSVRVPLNVFLLFFWRRCVYCLQMFLCQLWWLLLVECGIWSPDICRSLLQSYRLVVWCWSVW